MTAATRPAGRPGCVFFGAAVARYGIRGYRFVLLEAGAAGLAATLVAQEMQLASCMVGGFDDGAVLEVLDIDAAEAEVPLLAVAIGRRRSPGRA